MKKRNLSAYFIENDDFPDNEVGNHAVEGPVQDSTTDATNATKVNVKEEPVFDDPIQELEIEVTKSMKEL